MRTHMLIAFGLSCGLRTVLSCHLPHSCACIANPCRDTSVTVRLPGVNMYHTRGRSAGETKDERRGHAQCIYMSAC
ncbi:hypothetical protein C8F04DRAFT_1070988 [Mycena alexandri]|uniref:Secreted protein n=1 Tax=Mycena alexandri TaxID=1745969 RepID=A0AAD6TDG1_9AGAR|nr:hypothetical protein C8F04DRAFT_1070988 [Mycena alexandri]